MSKSLLKAKGRRESGAFIAVPFSVINSKNFKMLSAKSIKLFIDVCSQLRMKRGGPVNNGDLCITMKIMQERGWTSRDSLYLSRDELVYYGFICLTRKGGRNKAALYALTFFCINECGGKLDIKETQKPTNEWREDQEPWIRPTRKLKSLSRFSPSLVPRAGTTNEIN